MSTRADETARMGGFANLETQQLCAMCFTSARTVRRWKRTGLMPRLAHFVLELLTYGNVGVINKAFDGWTLKRDGKLHSPTGWDFTPSELVAVPLRMQEIAALRVQLDRAVSHRRKPCFERGRTRRNLATHHQLHGAASTTDSDHKPSA